jgi:hypothetical protein
VSSAQLTALFVRDNSTQCFAGVMPDSTIKPRTLLMHLRGSGQARMPLALVEARFVGVVRGLTALEPAQHVSCGYYRFQNIDVDTVKQEILLTNPDRVLDKFYGCWNIA